MEEIYSSHKKNEAVMALVNSVKNTHFITKCYEFGINNDHTKCFFCLQEMKREKSFLITRDDKFSFCSRICKEIFCTETNIFQNTNLRANKNIYFFPLDLLQDESKEKVLDYIVSMRDEVFDKIDIKYIADKKKLNSKEFKEIELIFSFQKNYEIYRIDKLKLKTIIFRDDENISNYLLANEPIPRSNDNLKPKSVEEEKCSKMLGSSSCLYCKQILSNETMLLIKLKKEENIFIGHVCSYFCSQVILTNYMRHISVVKTFFNFPLIHLIRDSELENIKKIIKMIKARPNVFLKTQYIPKKDIFIVNQELY